ncbi:cysteine hydrolase [Limibacillus halophilus]|uniref:Nicotinamidase-related amidase n=1 Tax=Limibacillus halophilus TaxID=1579333 RepID=A0A839SV87_9PROT|nr:cysteine hydrolase [Limibacillus halophilus]MBB3064863.1 nicotinamidase-related amidase [Limibacillus halophilus]
MKCCDHHNEGSAPDSEEIHESRRKLLMGGGAAAAVAAGVGLSGGIGVAEAAGEGAYADPAEPALPQTDVDVNLANTALVITDPQIDFLSPDGVTWGVVGASVESNGTVENIGKLLKAAKSVGMTVAISPHYYYPTDHGWKFGGPLEKLMHAIGMFDRKGPLSTDGFEGSGADFMPEYKPYIEDGKTIIASPHKVYGPEANDLSLQLRKAGIDKVILAGMSANLCVQAHLHELLEQGYEVAVVRDATAAAMLPEGDGYMAALINFRYIANALWTTEEATKRITEAA